MDDNNLKVLNKLQDINNKIGVMVSVCACIDVDMCTFEDDDVAGFSTILMDLQNNIKEVKELISKDLSS